MSRLLSWCTSKTGRNFTRCCVGAAALISFGCKIGVNGPFMDKLKEICQVYELSQPKPLPPKVNRIIEEVLQDCSLKEEQKKKLKFFYIVGHEVYHFGGIDSPWGAIVGIPFTFEDIGDLNLNKLRFQGRETIDWIIDGQDLLEALRISDSAKKFALLQEIYSCNFTDILTNAFVAAACIILPARLAQKLNSSSNAFERFTLRQRCLRYFGLYACGFFLYRMLKDPVKHLSDQKAISLAAETGPEYLNGGIEYFQKILERNKVLEELSNSRFMRKYDRKGNENYLLLAPKLPITKRLEYLQKMKNEKAVEVKN